MKITTLFLMIFFINSAFAESLSDKLSGRWVYNEKMTIDYLNNQYTDLESQSIYSNIAFFIHEYSDTEFKLFYDFYQKSVDEKIAGEADIVYQFKVTEEKPKLLVISFISKNKEHEQEIYFENDCHYLIRTEKIKEKGAVIKELPYRVYLCRHTDNTNAS